MTEEPEAVSDLPIGYGPVFRAKYQGRCSVCDQPVHEGDPIRRAGDEGAWVHTECVP